MHTRRSLLILLMVSHFWTEFDKSCLHNECYKGKCSSYSFHIFIVHNFVLSKYFATMRMVWWTCWTAVEWHNGRPQSFFWWQLAHFWNVDKFYGYLIGSTVFDRQISHWQIRTEIKKTVDISVIIIFKVHRTKDMTLNVWKFCIMTVTCVETLLWSGVPESNVRRLLILNYHGFWAFELWTIQLNHNSSKSVGS